MKHANNSKTEQSPKKYGKRLTGQEMGKIMGHAFDKAKARSKEIEKQTQPKK